MKGSVNNMPDFILLILSIIATVFFIIFNWFELGDGILTFKKFLISLLIAAPIPIWGTVVLLSDNPVVKTELVIPTTMNSSQYVEVKSPRTGSADAVNINEKTGKFVGKNQKVKIIYKSQWCKGVMFIDDQIFYEVVD